MKNVIATTALVLSLAAPAFADVSNAKAHFALGNDSAAERILPDVSTGDTLAVEAKIALENASAAERHIDLSNNATRGDIEAARALFAQGNDSAAEI